MNTEPMTIPEINLEYVTGGQRADPPPYDTTKPPSLGGGISGQAGNLGSIGGELGGGDDRKPAGK